MKKQLSAKRPPKAPSEELTRVIQAIYDDINDIIVTINNQLSEDNSVGKIGDFKVISPDVNTYKLQIKTKDGWVETDLSFVDK